MGGVEPVSTCYLYMGGLWAEVVLYLTRRMRPCLPYSVGYPRLWILSFCVPSLSSLWSAYIGFNSIA